MQLHHPSTYIPDEKVEEIRKASNLLDVIETHIELRKQGSSYVGDCPCCGGKKKFNYHPKKEIFKCFRCDIGGNSAEGFLTKVQGMDWKEAMLHLADRYGVMIIEENQNQNGSKTKMSRNRKIKFRDAQLAASGIPIDYQKIFLDGDEGQVESDRYQAATIDKSWNVIHGDDMVLHYLDIDGNLLYYKDQKGRNKPLIRVRWSNPLHHRDRDAKPIKYQSPYGSGSQLWIPNWMIKAYKKSEMFETLYICEGEKKADKMCLHGMPAVGIMGIHNFATGGDMPHYFDMIIKRCNVANVVFVLDADWQDLSIKDGKAVDQRPRTFLSAITKFKKYFEAMAFVGYDLRLYFAAGKDKEQKGIDDLLVNFLQGKEHELLEDFDSARMDPEGKGEYVDVYEISGAGPHKLSSYWNLHSKPAFVNAHKEELQKLKVFKYGKFQHRFNEQGELELAQKLMPQEQYWKKEQFETRTGQVKVKYSFDYVNVLEFLRNRGFGLYEFDKEKYRFIQLETRIVKDVSHHKIQRFILDFTRELDDHQESKEVLELLLRGGKQYLGPDKLMNMHMLKPTFQEPDKECQYLYFDKVYWKITADDIVERPIEELPRHVWEDRVLDFNPKLLPPMAHLERDGEEWDVRLNNKFYDAEMALFFYNSSAFHWRKLQEESEDEHGNIIFVEREKKEEVSRKELQHSLSVMVAKMMAAGYILHEYKDRSQMKAIICMDGEDSEVGRSMGGTGKSVWSTQFEYMIPTEVIDGKRKNLTDDPHLYSNVDERTQLIIFDDCRVNIDFENFFSQITRGIEVNPKGEKRFKIEPPKFIFNTNAAINGEGASYSRRQYYLTFSDYYNQHRTIKDEFGHLFFFEWDYEQWNLFYNWMAICIQTYLKYGLKYTIPSKDVERRRLRQVIGENVIEFFEMKYGPEGEWLNKEVEKRWAYQEYLEEYPSDKRYLNSRRFKNKFRKYAQYAGLDYNVVRAGEEDDRIRRNGREYLLISDEEYDANHRRVLPHSDPSNNPF
jgi:DNA primase